ncbi:hypothetical protein G7Y89_g15419 [Cudoniella acicularis]|uniref:Heterokaryon incompatibility domain-containing protein n=1 Tax=Cudoniella acicularis TaxID=354080 RepID=A0A8H4QQ19_9HELO|nr:hypothetical protein G7Y89_g15419 [Cudoniella acicularis]
MRLLNTTTLKLEEFFSDHVPKYAILSHRWEKEEVAFQDLLNGVGVSMAGYAKITGCCAQAISDGWQYAWVDSCCIDKSSSAELSEAINSMFKWYRNAQVCYVYLSDVPTGYATSLDPTNPNSTGSSKFLRSKWFTRGWTLQELLAPATVVFYDQEWVRMGTRADLESLLSFITGIQDFANFETACVAQKMSWASERETTRVEDKAYCLMGLFDVNMPPLYGEGENAFLRLQLEILSKSDDESIFAWTEEMGHALKTGLLARSPLAFKNCGNIEIGAVSKIFRMERPPYSMTNKGLRMEHFLVASPNPEVTDSLSLLNCKRAGTADYLAVFLFTDAESHFSRGYADELFELDLIEERKHITRKTLYIKQQTAVPGPFDRKRTIFSISLGNSMWHGFSVWKYYFASILDEWREGGGEFSGSTLIGRGSKAALSLINNHGETFAVVIGYGKNSAMKMRIFENFHRIEGLFALFDSEPVNAYDFNKLKTLQSGKEVSVYVNLDDRSEPGKLLHEVDISLRETVTKSGFWGPVNE